MDKIYTPRKEIIIEPSGRKRVITYHSGPDMTDQQYKEQCDVNNIVAQYKKGIPVTHISKTNGTYSDVSEIPDLHVIMDTVAKANQAFMELDPKLRRRFGNDPANYLDFLKDPKNDKEAVELGLKEIPLPPEIPTVRIEPNNATSNDDKTTIK